MNTTAVVIRTTKHNMLISNFKHITNTHFILRCLRSNNSDEIFRTHEYVVVMFGVVCPYVHMCVSVYLSSSCFDF